MSDKISVRIDLGVAKLEFAGVQIEQPIGITLDLPREKIAELILSGAAIKPVIAASMTTPVAKVAPEHSLVRPKTIASAVSELEEGRRVEFEKTAAANNPAPAKKR